MIQARIFAVVADYLAEPSSSRAPPCALSGDALRRRVESWDADADERDSAVAELHATVMGNPRSTPEDAALVARAAQKLAYVRRRVKVAAQIEEEATPRSPAPGGDTVFGDGGDGGDGGPRASASFCRRDPAAARRSAKFWRRARSRARGDGAARAARATRE